MSKWIKFTDRLPTEADVDLNKQVIAKANDGTLYVACRSAALRNPSWYVGHFWLENVPPLPKPRTIEDVVREYLAIGGGDFDSRVILRSEMREILEGKEQ